MSKKEKTKKEEFEEEIRIFKKNENAYYDMLTLYYSLLGRNHVPYIVIYTLTEKLISDLEDEEVSIKLKDDKDVFDIMHDIDKKYDEIKNKYKNIDECKELYYKFNAYSYKENIIYENFMNYYQLEEKDKFDLIKTLTEKNMFFPLKMFLVSDIPFEDKINIFSDFIIHYFNNENIVNHVSELSRWVKMSQLKEVIDSYDCKGLANCITYNKQYRYISYLQEYFNLNSKDILYVYNYNGERLTISFVGAVVCFEQSISNIKELYESESYMELPKKIRDNNDLAILENINAVCIEDFIKLSNFEITDEKIDALSNMLISLYIDDKTIKLVEKYLNKHSLAILHKAKNKSEYKEMLKYVKRLEENVKLGIEQIKKEEKDKILYRSLVAVTLKEVENKIEDRLSNLTINPKKLRKVLTVEDLKEDKN